LVPHATLTTDGRTHRAQSAQRRFCFADFAAFAFKGDPARAIRISAML
jgi:hypothetical protein